MRMVWPDVRTSGLTTSSGLVMADAVLVARLRSPATTVHIHWARWRCEAARPGREPARTRRMLGLTLCVDSAAMERSSVGVVTTMRVTLLVVERPSSGLANRVMMNSYVPGVTKPDGRDRFPDTSASSTGCIGSSQGSHHTACKGRQSNCHRRACEVLSGSNDSVASMVRGLKTVVCHSRPPLMRRRSADGLTVTMIESVPVTNPVAPAVGSGTVTATVTVYSNCVEKVNPGKTTSCLFTMTSLGRVTRRRAVAPWARRLRAAGRVSDAARDVGVESSTNQW
mmetsp:Transcript_45230/g.106738  ORF Transcript_45230/g.106738 Transcript_45230/m.106738 type:complete len:282 (+) Transcript_45230:3829-4674(+)